MAPRSASVAERRPEQRRAREVSCAATASARRFYVIARGSAGEIAGALDTADAWGWRVDSALSRKILDRQLALLWGLCR